MKSHAHSKPLLFALVALVSALMLQGVILVSAPEIAEAGVLVKRVSIRNTRTPKAHIRRAKESTAALRRTNPSFKIKGDTEKSVAKIQKQRTRYLKQLHQWQKQKDRVEERARRKQQQQMQALAKQQRDRARMSKKKRGTPGAGSSVSADAAAANRPRSTVTVGKRSETGAKPSLFERDRGKENGAKKGLLTHFWKALFG